MTSVCVYVDIGFFDTVLSATGRWGRRWDSSKFKAMIDVSVVSDDFLVDGRSANLWWRRGWRWRGCWLSDFSLFEVSNADPINMW